MTVSDATFERLKSKGIAAFKRGEFTTAKGYLTEAAECMIERADAAKSPDAQRQHTEIAQSLIELARECNERSNHHAGQRRAKLKDDDEGGADANDWIVRDRPTLGFKDIAGLEEVKQDVRLKMIYPMNHPELAARYGIGVGGGLLLYGPPGTGKTMLGKAIAHELDATFFVVSPAQVLSKWVGEAEQNIRKLFDSAKQEDKAVIFIDEIEALVPKRKSDSSSVMQRVVPQILQELEGFDRKAGRALLFVGATNRPWLLDEAMMRPGRFDTRVYVGLPDAPARFRLLEIYFDNKPLAGDVDFGELCDMLDGYTGADIKHIARQAAAIPFLEGVAGGEPREITKSDILKVFESTPPSVKSSDVHRFTKFRDTGD
jgi:transitional endoplasmic reticulum ATPase